VTDFWQNERRTSPPGHAAAAHFEFAFWRLGVSRGLAEMRLPGSMTQDGRDFLAGMARKAAEFRALPVPSEPLVAAVDADLDHWLSWRLRNLRPGEDSIAVLAAAWRSGAPFPGARPPDAKVVPGRRAFDRNARLPLIRRYLASPATFAEVTSGPAEDLDVRAADLAYVVGDHPRAHRLYLDVLRANPAQNAAWAGLALTGRRVYPASEADWTATPEVAKFLQAELAVDPDDIVAWISGRAVRPEAAR
jgi:hypothetical protein